MEETAKHFRKRDAILSCLRNSAAHPSAEALYRELKEAHSDISLATVYRNLALFREQGLIISLGTVGGIERFDGRLDPHVHFACTRCGCVADLPEQLIPQSVTQNASRSLGCRVDDVRLMLTGLCSSCMSDEI